MRGIHKGTKSPSIHSVGGRFYTPSLRQAQGIARLPHFQKERKWGRRKSQFYGQVSGLGTAKTTPTRPPSCLPDGPPPFDRLRASPTSPIFKKRAKMGEEKDGRVTDPPLQFIFGQGKK